MLWKIFILHLFYIKNFISLLAVYSSLGYKNAVGACYEEKLSEARREAQQDCNYATDRDVSIVFVSWWKLSLILSI